MIRPFLLIPFVFLTLIAPAQAGVELRNVQACFGPYGPVRTKLDVAPHEELMFRFTIAGLKTGPDGKTNAVLTVTLVDAAGKEVLNQPKPVQTVTPYGTDACPGTASLIVGATAIPGEYSLRVSVDDKLAVGSARFVRKVTVKPATFRVLNPRFFVDPTRTLPGPCGGFPGQTLYLRVQAANPTLHEGRTAVAFKLQVLDLEGVEVLRPPVTVRREADDGKTYHAFGLETEVPLARAGEYLLRLTIFDEQSKEEAKLDLPLSVNLP